MKTTGIILLAGNSTRYGKNYNKNFEKINEQYIVSYSLNVFNENQFINEIILVVRRDDLKIVREIIQKMNLNKDLKVVLGGKSRGESVFNALREATSSLVVIHDGARPLIKDEYINNCLSYLGNYKGVVTGIKVKDTIKITNELGEIVNTPERINTWAAQTPQAFDKNILLELYSKYQDIIHTFTDDASLLERAGYKVKLVEGSYTNIKITTKEDIEFVKEYVKKYNR